MNSEIRSYQQLGNEYEHYTNRMTKQDVDDRLFYLCMKHEVDDVEICDLKEEDFGNDSEEASELLAILGEIGAFWAKYDYEYDE